MLSNKRTYMKKTNVEGGDKHYPEMINAQALSDFIMNANEDHYAISNGAVSLFLPHLSFRHLSYVCLIGHCFML